MYTSNPPLSKSGKAWVRARRSEGDLTRFERDRIRARIAEEQAFLEVIDAAQERTHSKKWKNCTRCGNPIGDPRLEALPATDLCVTCKADRGTW